MSRARDERGSITPFVVIVSLAILMLAALVLDGGRQLNARGRATAYAQEAARAGSQAVDVSDPRLDLDSGDALKAASTYCRQAMAADAQLASCAPGITSVTDQAGTFKAVRVTVRVQIKAILLGIIGRSDLRSTGEAIARPVSGIREADSGKVSDVGPPTVAAPGQGPSPSTAPPSIPDVTVAPCTPKESIRPTPKPPKPTKPPKPRPGRPSKPPKPTKPPKPLPPQPPVCKDPPP